MNNNVMVTNEEGMNMTTRKDVETLGKIETMMSSAVKMAKADRMDESISLVEKAHKCFTESFKDSEAETHNEEDQVKFEIIAGRALLMPDTICEIFESIYM